MLSGLHVREYLLCHCLLPASLLTKLEQILLVGWDRHGRIVRAIPRCLPSRRTVP